MSVASNPLKLFKSVLAAFICFISASKHRCLPCLPVSLCTLLTPFSASQSEFLNPMTTAQENSSKSTKPIWEVYFKVLKPLFSQKKKKKNKLNLMETTMLSTLQCFGNDPLPHFGKDFGVVFSEILSRALLCS